MTWEWLKLPATHLVATAFVITVIIAVAKAFGFAKGSDAIDRALIFAEFPIDATAAYFSLALGVMATTSVPTATASMVFVSLLAILLIQVLCFRIHKELAVADRIHWKTAKQIATFCLIWIGMICSTIFSIFMFTFDWEAA